MPRRDADCHNKQHEHCKDKQYARCDIWKHRTTLQNSSNANINAVNGNVPFPPSKGIIGTMPKSIVPIE